MEQDLGQAQWIHEERLLSIHQNAYPAFFSDEEEALLNEDLDEFAIRMGYLQPD
jgi:hypothetical protein